MGAPCCRPVARRLAVLRASIVACLWAAVPASAGDAPAVRPGGLVRWPALAVAGAASEGPPALVCRQAGSPPFAALDGQCLFPIDLLATGEVVVERLAADGAWERRALRVAPYPYETQRLTIAEDKYVNPSREDLARIAAEQARVDGVLALRTPRRFSLPLGPPLDLLPPGGRFGARRVLNGQPRSPHAGVDYAAATGTPVRAPADGRVALAEEQFYAGRAVYVDHGDGLLTMAFHLSAIAVRAGDEVRRGQLLGAVGATGRVTGAHLHFAVRWRGARVDPALLLGAPRDLAEIP